MPRLCEGTSSRAKIAARRAYFIDAAYFDVQKRQRNDTESVQRQRQSRAVLDVAEVVHAPLKKGDQCTLFG